MGGVLLGMVRAFRTTGKERDGGGDGVIMVSGDSVMVVIRW